jgi:hypothetical protein
MTFKVGLRETIRAGSDARPLQFPVEVLDGFMRTFIES